MNQEDVTVYQRGRVDYYQSAKQTTEKKDFYRIVNHKKGPRLEIASSVTGNIIYHGNFNEKMEKEGWGIEFDNENRQMAVEGIWSKGTMTEIIRLFNGDTMTELKRNGKNSLDPFKRIPIYVGGFRYDEDSETFYREGKGCLIDEDSKAAKREGEWKDGREISGVDLSAGWYCKNEPNQAPNQAKSEVSVETIPKKDLRSKDELTRNTLCRPDSASIVKKGKTTVRNMNELSSLSLSVTDLVISPNCCNTVTALDLNRLESLESIEIGDHCFASVQSFNIDGLHKLHKLYIKHHSFTQMKEYDKWDYEKANNKSKTFCIANCESLVSIDIERFSFGEFAGQFKLKNLDALISLTIGSMEKRSFNFYFCSFVIKGILLCSRDECL